MNNKSGQINLYIGCMFSGKTSELIRECRRRLHINSKILCINYTHDKRYTDSDFIVAHNQDKISCIRAEKLSEVDSNLVLNAECIFIDEGQFFSDLKEYTLKWCEEYNKNITVIGLDGDFKRNIFGHILDLIPVCDNFYKLKALCNKCRDGTEALFTYRLSQEAEQVVIGSSNYIPVCRYHYIELSNSDNNNSNDENKKNN
jgi:thymidine kinase